MVDVPRSAQPSDAERLSVLLDNMNSGHASGESRSVGPIFRRDLAQAAVVGVGDAGSIDETDSKIDGPDESLSNTIVAPDPISAGQAVSRQVQNDLWASGALL
jgi:hypothetical protein